MNKRQAGRCDISASLGSTVSPLLGRSRSENSALPNHPHQHSSGGLASTVEMQTANFMGASPSMHRSAFAGSGFQRPAVSSSPYLPNTPTLSTPTLTNNNSTNNSGGSSRRGKGASRRLMFIGFAVVNLILILYILSGGLLSFSDDRDAASNSKHTITSKPSFLASTFQKPVAEKAGSAMSRANREEFAHELRPQNLSSSEGSSQSGVRFRRVDRVDERIRKIQDENKKQLSRIEAERVKRHAEMNNRVGFMNHRHRPPPPAAAPGPVQSTARTTARDAIDWSRGAHAALNRIGRKAVDSVVEASKRVWKIAANVKVEDVKGDNSTTEEMAPSVAGMLRPEALLDAKRMVNENDCGEGERVKDDEEHPNSDCQFLQREFGMCHANLPKKSTDYISSLFAQGYITVKGLEDPLTATAAIVDEFRRIAALGAEGAGNRSDDKGENTLKFPLGGVDAYVEGEGEAIEATAPPKPFAKRTFSLDIVFTEVDFNEPSFQADRMYYREVFNKPAASAAGDGRPASSGAMTAAAIQQRTKEHLVKVYKALATLPWVWEELAKGRYGELITTMHPDDYALTPDEATNSTTTTTTTTKAAAAMNLTSEALASLLPTHPLFKFVSEMVNRSEDAIAALAKAKLDPQELPRVLHALSRSTSDSANRFRNFNELRYSLRGIHRYIIEPMEEAVRKGTGRYAFGKIYIIVSHKEQAPTWLREHPRIVLVEQAGLFPNPRRSLPTFNSRVIESVMHRIPGLSRHFIYLNNDYMLTRPLSFFDYFQPYVLWEDGSASPIGAENSTASLKALFTAPSIRRPTVKFLPVVRSCTVMRAVADRKWLWHVAPKEAAAIVQLVKLVGGANGNKKILGFATGNSHNPQMFDKLQMMRILTDPAIRPLICNTRASRERTEKNWPPAYAYIHFSILWRFGWENQPADRANTDVWRDRTIGFATPHRVSEDYGFRIWGKAYVRTALWDYARELVRAATALDEEADGNVVVRTTTILKKEVKPTTIQKPSTLNAFSLPRGPTTTPPPAPEESRVLALPPTSYFTPQRLAVITALDSIFRTVNRAAMSNDIARAVRVPTVDVLPLLSFSAEEVAEKEISFETQAVIAGGSSPDGPRKGYDHWLVTMFNLMCKPIQEMAESSHYIFGMGVDLLQLKTHEQRVQKTKQLGMALMVENDDMPNGDRTPSPHGVFGAIPSNVISLICSFEHDVWEAATVSGAVNVSFGSGAFDSAEALIPTSAPASPITIVAPPQMKLLYQLGFHDDRALSDVPTVDPAYTLEAVFSERLKSKVEDILAGGLGVVGAPLKTTTKAPVKPFGGNAPHVSTTSASTTTTTTTTKAPPQKPSPFKRLARKARIGDRIAFACALEEAHMSLAALELASRRDIADEGDVTPQTDQCRVGTRYRDASIVTARKASAETFTRDYPRMPKVPTFVAKSRADALRGRVGVLRSSAAPKLPANSHEDEVAIKAYSKRLQNMLSVARHNCSNYPLPLSEVPPAADVYGADVFLSVIRTAIGDCDTRMKKISIPPWEIEGC